MDEKKKRNLKKDAKVSMERQEYPNGYVYAFVNGKKSFFPLDKVLVTMGNNSKTTVKDLIKVVENQNNRIDKIKDIIIKLNDKIKKIEKENKRWNG